MHLAWFPKVRYYLVQDVINDLYINTVLWLVFNYFNYFDQFEFVFETVDISLSVSHFMHDESLQRILWIFVHRILFKVSRPNKLSHNCLSQDLNPSVCLSCMPPSNRSLAILAAAKANQREQQRLRTERRLAQLRQEQRQLDRREVLTLFALIWVVGIVLFFTRLYLGPSL